MSGEPPGDQPAARASEAAATRDRIVRDLRRSMRAMEDVAVTLERDACRLQSQLRKFHGGVDRIQIDVVLLYGRVSLLAAKTDAQVQRVRGTTEGPPEVAR